MNIPEDFRRSIEYGAGDEWSVEEWTIRDTPEHVPDLCCNHKLMRRVVYRGPWEEA